MKEHQSIFPLLESVVNDNQTFLFPVDYIRMELIQISISMDEFEYMIRQAHRKIRLKYGATYGSIFIQILDFVLSAKQKKVPEYTNEEYFEIIDEFIHILENTKITRIDKSSPDGIMISAMK